MRLFVVGIVFHVVMVDSSILCSWWWLPLCSFFALGGSAKYLEVGLNPQKEFKRAHLQLKGNGVPDTFNMSFFQKGRRWAHHHQKKCQIPSSRLTHAKPILCISLQRRQTSLPRRGELFLFHISVRFACVSPWGPC